MVLHFWFGVTRERIALIDTEKSHSDIETNLEANQPSVQLLNHSETKSVKQTYVLACNIFIDNMLTSNDSLIACF